MSLLKPALIGAAMGAMTLWMVHGALSGDTATSGLAVLAFVGVHIVLGLVVVLGCLFAARLSTRVRRGLSRMHRPTLRHIGTMLGAAGVSIVTAHLVIHTVLNGGLT